ncbi:MAG: NFYB/HAP3 family transcription factor subunit [Candidatus Anstonellaceae archaeon]
MILPKASVEKLIRSAGAERVSDSATLELLTILEKVGQEISQQAKIYATHAGRKTIVDQDIKLAFENLYKK